MFIFPPHLSPMETDLIIYCRDGILSEGLRYHLLAHSHSLRISTVSTEEAFASILAESTAPVLVILSGALTDTLLQFRVLYQLQCAHRKQMMLYRGDAFVLRTLLPFYRWFELYAPVTRHIWNIFTWLAETKLPAFKPPLSHLTSRQLDILLRLANGQMPHYIASRLCISVRTVSTHRTEIKNRLGIIQHSGWTLLCAAVREASLYPDAPVWQNFSPARLRATEILNLMDNK